MGAFGTTSLRRRVFTGVLTTTVAALLIAGTMMVAYQLDSYRKRIVQDMSAQANLVGFASTPALLFNDRELAKTNLALLRTRPEILAAAIYTPNGAIFAEYHTADAGNAGFPALPGTDNHRIEADRLHLFHRIVANGEIIGTVYLAVHYQLYDILLQQALLVLSAIVVALIISMLLSLWMQARLTGPILGIAHLAQRIARQRDYGLRASKTTDDEIGVLADAFNDLVSEVERSRDEMNVVNSELHQQIEVRRQTELEVQRLNEQLENRVAERTEELERANHELEAFSYSVSHDLRAPLRAIDGFSQALMEDCNDSLDDTGRNYLSRVRNAAQRMGNLIDDLLKLSRINRMELNLQEVDLSEMVAETMRELRAEDSGRSLETRITSGLVDTCDPQMMRIVVENLLSNALKYSCRREHTVIEFGMRNRAGKSSYFVQDNGIGFDMKYADKLFGAFQRLHNDNEYPGTGIGLATVQRIISRHGGRIWADSEVDRGTTFYFTLE